MVPIRRFMMVSCGALALAACGETADVTKDKAADTAAAQKLNAPQKAYAEANKRMHAGMGTIDADADTAFIQGMIPHHQGAVDMARIVLEHGDNEEAKELARNIIKAQEEEMAWMRGWLKERGLSETGPATVDHEAMGH